MLNLELIVPANRSSALSSCMGAASAGALSSWGEGVWRRMGLNQLAATCSRYLTTKLCACVRGGEARLTRGRRSFKHELTASLLQASASAPSSLLPSSRSASSCFW